MPGAEFRAPIALAGCTPENLAELRTRLDKIDRRIGYYEVERSETVVAEVRAAWEHPCLSHFARFFRAPPMGMDIARFSDVWRRGMGASLLAMAGALYKREKKAFVVVPPEEPAPLTAKERSMFATWLCPDGHVQCGHAGSYVERAHEAFDRAELLAHRWNGALVGSASDDPMPNSFLATRTACDDRKQTDEEKAVETPFETFVVCVASWSPRTWRYPRAARMRSRERGWLVLRGRRGHYQFTDELSVFDLSTGAAFIGKSGSALVLTGPSVDFDAIDKKRKQEIVTGRVAVDQVRELAFLLATAPLLRAQRSEVQIVPVPDDLQVTLSPARSADSPFDITESGWSSSDQTSIAWQVVDGGTTIAEGDFTWPSSFRAWETHAAELVRVMEAGLVTGCTPARLPRGVVQGPSGAVHPLDADPDAQADVFASLGKKLEALGDRPCAKR